MPDYPNLKPHEVVPFGPGFITIGKREFDQDVALALYPLTHGETIASLELISFDRDALIDISPRVLIELTADDCLTLARRLYDCVVESRDGLAIKSTRVDTLVTEMAERDPEHADEWREIGDSLR